MKEQSKSSEHINIQTRKTDRILKLNAKKTYKNIPSQIKHIKQPKSIKQQYQNTDRNKPKQ